MRKVNHVRSWPLHPLSLGFTLVLVGSLSLVNLYPRVRWGHVNYYLIDEELAHGWPLVYMQRDFQIANADMGGMYHGVWPIERNPGPVRKFRFNFLIVDIVVAVTLTAMTIAAIESLLQARNVRTRFSLATMLAITAGVCLLLAVQRVFPLHIFALHLIPNCVIIFSLVCASLFVAKATYRCFTTRPAQR